MVESGVGVDFFLAAPGGGYLDIATVGAYIRAKMHSVLAVLQL